MNVDFETQPDVPDLIALLADRFVRGEFTIEDACLIVMDMLADAMRAGPEKVH